MISIGTTQRIVRLLNGELLEGIEMNLQKYFYNHGYTLLPIPNFFSDIESLETWCKFHDIQRFLLSGGDDPRTLDSRSQLELAVMNYADKNSFPVLGICRGFQAMVLYLGGSLVECTGHVGKVHELNGQISSEVICFHEQTISQLPHQFYVTEKSSDGLIEGAARSDRPWIGWMWHPERLISPSNEIMNAISNLYA